MSDPPNNMTLQKSTFRKGLALQPVSRPLARPARLGLRKTVVANPLPVYRTSGFSVGLSSWLSTAGHRPRFPGSGPARECMARTESGPCRAYPSAAGALDPERGARRATGDTACQPTVRVGQRASRWRPPHLQGSRPCLSRRHANPSAGDALVPERGARRATGRHAHHKRPPRSALTRLRGGDHRISRGCRHANPSAGDALVPERGARRATERHAYHRYPHQIGADAPSRWRPPHLQEAPPCQSQPYAEHSSRGGTEANPTRMRSRGEQG